MRARILLFVLLSVPLATAQEVVDRIAARIGDDIITLSEVRELERFQELVDGRASADDRLLEQLLEQWIAATEAAAAHFPQPAEADVESEMKRLVEEFVSPEAYRARLRALGLTERAVRRLLERRLYLTRYLDYKFRPSAQITSEQVEKYHREQLAPDLRARGRDVPPLETVQDQVRELLTQREITERAGRWLEEAKARLKIERRLKEQ